MAQCQEQIWQLSHELKKEQEKNLAGLALFQVCHAPAAYLQYCRNSLPVMTAASHPFEH